MSTPLEIIAAALARERARAELSVSELARRAEIGKSTLSMLEAGKGNPSLETLWALSTALEIPFWRLAEPAPEAVTVIRSSEGNRIAAETSTYAGTLLSAGSHNMRRDIYRIHAEPGPARNSIPHAPGTIEHVILVAGKALVGPAESPVELEVGDYINYRGDRPHIFDALESGTIALFVSESLL